MVSLLRGRLADDASQLRALCAAFSWTSEQLWSARLNGLDNSSGGLHFSDATVSEREGASSKHSQRQRKQLGAGGRVVASGSHGGASGIPNDSPDKPPERQGKTLGAGRGKYEPGSHKGALGGPHDSPVKSLDSPVKPPEKEKGEFHSLYFTPLDLVKRRMWESGLQPAGPLSVRAHENIEGAAEKRSIQYLDVYREKLAELTALEELTFDDVDKWSPKSSEKVNPVDKGRMCLTLARNKLRLLLAYHELQIVPMRRLFAWAVPTEEALETIKLFSPNGVVEIGAGTGYWAALLEERGVSVRAFDRAPVHLRLNGHHLPVSSTSLRALAAKVDYPRELEIIYRDEDEIREMGFGWVEEGGPTFAKLHPERSLFLCWPPIESDEGAPEDVNSMGVDALNAYEGSTLVYVGEPFDGELPPDKRTSQTAGPRYERSLKEGGWKLRKEVQLPHWPRCRDRLQVWTRGDAEVSPGGKGTKHGYDHGSSRGSASGTGESVEALRRKLRRLTKEASSSRPLRNGKASGEKGVFSWDSAHGVSQSVTIDVLEAVAGLHTAQLDVRRKAGTRAGEAERQVYMEELRELWDTVASEIIDRRVREEWRARRVHAPLARIEEEAIRRHMARAGFLSRWLLRMRHKMVKMNEDST